MMQLDINECRVLMQLLNNCTFQVQGNVIPILGQIMNKLNQAIELDKQAKEAQKKAVDNRSLRDM